MLHIIRGVRKTPSFWLCALLLVVLLLASNNLNAQSTSPYVEDGFFVMPVVQVYDTPYRIVWQIVETIGFIDLLLHEHEQLLEAETSGAPSYYGELLNVPDAQVNGVSFWGEFAIESEQPVIFRLLMAEANNAGSTGVQGKWRIIEEADASACGEGTETTIYSLRVLESNSGLSVISNVGSFSAGLSGLSLQWSGSFAEDGGTTSAEVNVMFAESLHDLTGVSQWTWSNGSQSCEGTSFFTGELLHN